MLVAYHIYRGPGGELPEVPGLLPRSEFGLEILVTLAFEVVIVGLSMDKTIGQLGFFWNLSLGKSQVDSLLNRLARDWEPEFDALCELLAVSAVVHADETSWSINSVWALLSEKARVLVFGCHKDAATLEALLPKDVFAGVLVSDDAALTLMDCPMIARTAISCPSHDPGRRVPGNFLITGAVLSRLIVALVVAVLPALSTAVPEVT